MRLEQQISPLPSPKSVTDENTIMVWMKTARVRAIRGVGAGISRRRRLVVIPSSFDANNSRRDDRDGDDDDANS